MQQAMLGKGGFRPLVRISARYAGYCAYREKMAEFDLMSDRELCELNLSRAALREMARDHGARCEAAVLAAA